MYYHITVSYTYLKTAIKSALVFYFDELIDSAL